MGSNRKSYMRSWRGRCRRSSMMICTRSCRRSWMGNCKRNSSRSCKRSFKRSCTSVLCESEPKCLFKLHSLDDGTQMDFILNCESLESVLFI